MSLTLSAIATIRTPYKEKFAIPRQPGLVTAAEGVIEFGAPYNDPNLIRGIEQFSHLWLIFQFHHTSEQGWSPLVRPPRLGGNEKMGVLATRSTFRPNNMGLSVVEFVKSEFKHGQLTLVVKGVDLVDGTPVFDIKPYVPYADALPHAQAGYAADAPCDDLPTDFSEQAKRTLAGLTDTIPHFEILIQQVLAQDPRPAFHKSQSSDREYGMRLYDFNIRWQVIAQRNVVTDIRIADEK